MGKSSKKYLRRKVKFRAGCDSPVSPVVAVGCVKFSSLDGVGFVGLLGGDDVDGSLFSTAAGSAEINKEMV